MGADDDEPGCGCGPAAHSRATRRRTATLQIFSPMECLGELRRQEAATARRPSCGAHGIVEHVQLCGHRDEGKRGARPPRRKRRGSRPRSSGRRRCHGPRGASAAGTPAAILTTMDAYRATALTRHVSRPGRDGAETSAVADDLELGGHAMSRARRRQTDDGGSRQPACCTLTRPPCGPPQRPGPPPTARRTGPPVGGGARPAHGHGSVVRRATGHYQAQQSLAARASGVRPQRWRFLGNADDDGPTSIDGHLLAADDAAVAGQPEQRPTGLAVTEGPSGSVPTAGRPSLLHELGCRPH